MRKAKIICTIGPATSAPDMLDALIAAGMNAARLNFSHGTRASHADAIAAIRRAAEQRDAAVAIIQDLQGPRIRVGTLPGKGLTVEPDQRVWLVPEAEGARPGTGGAAEEPHAQVIPVTYARLARDVRPEARVLVDDGNVELTVRRVVGDAVECVVARGGRVTSRKGINLPGTAISEPTLTEKDREDLRFGLDQGVDYVALSFVRSPDDVAAARKCIAEQGADVPVIAKIERPEAVDCLHDLLREADGVMVARGDLGVEMGPEAVPLLQKRIITEANRRRCLVITATQMLESMTASQQPTRAEASDVANAVFDGTDAVMLSAETSVGRYPIDAVRVMDRVVRAAEAGSDLRRPAGGEAAAGDRSIPEAVCAAACEAATAIEAGAIAAFTESGTTARLLSKRRPRAPIFAFTPSEAVRRRMALYAGVSPHRLAHLEDADARVTEAEAFLKRQRALGTGQRLVLVSGSVTGHRGGTNMLSLYEVSERT